MRQARGHHAQNQRIKALAAQLGHGFEQRPAEYLGQRAAPQRGNALVGHRNAQVGALKQAHGHGGLFEQGLQVGALALGGGPGGLLAGLAFAQGGFDGRARRIVRVGEAHEQARAHPLGGQAVVAIEAIELVGELPLVGFVVLVHGPVKIQNAEGFGAGRHLQVGAGGPGRQLQHALGRRAEQLKPEVDDTARAGPGHGRTQHQGTERSGEKPGQQVIGREGFQQVGRESGRGSGGL